MGPTVTAPPETSHPAPAPVDAPGSTRGALAQLLPLLRSDPTFVDLQGLRAAVVSVPEPARAFAIAGAVEAAGRHPAIVAVPTAGDAERLAHDLAAWLGPDAVELAPAWETLPLERVSPSVETMGRRLRAMWRLLGGTPTAGVVERAPRVLVAPIRSLLQRLGPGVEHLAPVVVRRGEQIDPDVLVARLVAMGYRREYQVEHRGELAVRGSIVDVFGSTAEGPVRIDLWGDEVDRLTEFGVGDQRSTDDIEVVELFGCRELLPSHDLRATAAALVGRSPGDASSGSAWPRA